MESLQLLQFWKDRYVRECQDMEKYGGSYSWGFEIDVFFTETDHMILICSDLEKVTVVYTDFVLIIIYRFVSDMLIIVQKRLLQFKYDISVISLSKYFAICFFFFTL